MANKLNLKINNTKFADFVAKLHDVSNINDVVKVKIDTDNILIYSTLANDNAILALKSYLLDTNEYIENFNENDTFDFIIVNTPKFIKGLKFFNTDAPIKLDITYKSMRNKDDVMQVRSAQFSNGKLKISTIGGEDSMIADIISSKLEQRCDINKCDFSFKMDKPDYLDVKKLCSIDSEDKVFSITIDKGNVVAEEISKWELKLDQIDPEHTSKIVFNKKYLSNINSDIDIINFYKFETFLLVKDDNSNLMLSFEQTFE